MGRCGRVLSTGCETRVSDTWPGCVSSLKWYLTMLSVARITVLMKDGWMDGWMHGYRAFVGSY